MLLQHAIAVLEFVYNAVVYYSQSAQGQAELVALEGMFGVGATPTQPPATGQATRSEQPAAQAAVVSARV